MLASTDPTAPIVYPVARAVDGHGARRSVAVEISGLAFFYSILTVIIKLLNLLFISIEFMTEFS